MPTTTRTTFMIERSDGLGADPVYLAARDLYFGDAIWTHDPGEAVRWRYEADALRYQNLFRMTGTSRVIEAIGSEIDV